MKKNIFLLITIVASLMLVVPYQGLAQPIQDANTLLPHVTTDPATGVTKNAWAKECLEKGDCHLSQIPSFILYIATYLIGLSGTIALIMVMYGGYLYILGGVSEANKGKGVKTISTALLGLAVTLLSYLIVKALEGLFLS